MKKVASFVQVNQDTLWHSLMMIEGLMKELKKIRKNLREMLKMENELKEVK